jgi:hypothetical protein
MSDPNPGPAPAPRRLRWWPAWLVLAAAVVAITVVRFRDDLTFQQRNLTTGAFLLGTLGIGMTTMALIVIHAMTTEG